MSADAERIAQAAADWLGRHDAGLTEAEEMEFLAWLDADPRHADAFERLNTTSAALDDLAAFRPVGDAAPDPDLPLRPSLAPVRRVHWLPLALAAAAALAIGYVGLWRPLRTGPVYAETATTAVGALRTLNLPDGSVVALNTDSAVEFAFSRGDRRVALVRGEAHFTVAKDPGRPFIVSAGGVGVRAVGTAFNVRLRGGEVDVLVTEGRVGLSETRNGTSLLPPSAAATEPPVLAAGHRAVIAAPTTTGPAGAPVVRIAAVPASEITRALSWQTRRLEFGPTPLREVVAEFNRYNRHQLVVADDATGALRVGGSFEAGSFDTLVRLLESSFGVVAEKNGDRTVLRRK